MSKENFASLVLTKLRAAVGNDSSAYSSGTAVSAQSAIGEAVTEYLVANTIVTISYNGVLASGGEDVIAADTIKISGSCQLTSVPAQFNSWVAALQSAIASAFVVQPPSTQGIVTSFQPFSSIAGALQIPLSKLKNAHEGNIANPALSVWTEVCGGILDWLNSAAGLNPNAVAIAAIRSGISSGTATLLSINVS